MFIATPIERLNLQKELTHNICIDFQASSRNEVRAAPEFRRGKYFNPKNVVWHLWRDHSLTAE